MYIATQTAMAKHVRNERSRTSSCELLPKLSSASSQQTELLSQVLQYKSGARFEGQIQQHLKVGRGLFIWPNGAQYDGEFVDDSRQGKGKQQWPDGSTYVGEFVNDMRHGTGVQKWANGEKYVGEFFKDCRHGKGRYSWMDGASFEGAFHLERKEGYGHFIFANGNEFKGLYKNNEREGPGVMTYKKSGRQDVGLWHGENLVRLCVPVSGVFSLADSMEYSSCVLDNRASRPRLSVDVNSESAHINAQSFYRDTPDTTSFVTDTNSGYEKSEIELNSASSPAESNSAELEDEYAIAWNNTPSCITMQKHILKHKDSEDSVDFSVGSVLFGQNRNKFQDAGVLEVTSVKFLEVAQNGDLTKVNNMLNKGEVFVDVAEVNGNAALIGVSVNWHVAVINALLDSGADVNRLNNEGVSALSACHAKFYSPTSFQYNIAETGLERPADFEEEPGYKIGEHITVAAPSHKASVAKKTMSEANLQKIRKLRETFAVDDSEDNSVSDGETCKDSQTQSASSECSEDEDEKSVSKRTTEFHSKSALHNLPMIVSNEMIDRCATQLSTNRMVVSRERSALEDPKMVGTARALAIDKSQQQLMQSTIQLLLRRGADPNASSVPMPVLFFAIKACDVEAVKLLLLKGAFTNSRLPDTKGSLAPLHIACAMPGDAGVQMTELLLDSLADPDVRALEDDSYLNTNLMDEWINDPVDSTSLAISGGRTPLHIACARQDNYKNACRVVRALLKHHANPNVICNGQSPLTLAIISGNDLAVDELLSRGADPCLPLTKGVGNALCVAANTDYEGRRSPDARLKLIDKLLKAGADILYPIPVGPKRSIGTAVDYAFHVYNLDRRIAHMPYHALNPTEREIFNVRRSLLEHLGHHLRAKAVQKYQSAAGHVSFRKGNDPYAKKSETFRYCYDCGRSVNVKLSACTRCKQVFYCSKACKMKAWNARHKDECMRLGEANAPIKKTKDRSDSPTPGTDPDRGQKTTVAKLLSEDARVKSATSAAFLRQLESGAVKVQTSQ